MPHEEDLSILDVNSEEDEDIEAANKAFPTSYNCIAKKAISLENDFITKMDAFWYSGITGSVAVGLSNNSVIISNTDNLATINNLKGHRDVVTKVRYSKLDSNLIYTSSMDRTIKRWDIRIKESCVNTFKDNTEGPEPHQWKPFSTMDVNCSDTFICGGTEKNGDDSFLLFFDVRNPKVLGGYWESHSEDVRFHPNDANYMASSSIDGLINVFDISKNSEEDALLYTLGSEVSPDTLKWLKRSNAIYNHLGVVCQSEEYQLWDIE
ncbi:WD repeat-containing protein 89-like isoform X2 [Artemia franciscana]|uniref:WD repeat-containing protein 89-like isoform X2 n=1 Tax=Artemia franciscana TaxID=6661 RepID=UPI0032D9D933